MTPPKSLLEVLRGLRDHEEMERMSSALGRDEWIAELQTLVNAVRIWLRPATSEGLAQVDPIEVTLDDAPTGRYEAPGLRIALPGGRVVWLRPAGILRVGAKGWVDLTCGPQRAMIVLNRQGVWKVRGPSGGDAKLEELNEASFARAMAELVA